MIAVARLQRNSTEVLLGSQTAVISAFRGWRPRSLPRPSRVLSEVEQRRYSPRAGRNLGKLESASAMCPVISLADLDSKPEMRRSLVD